MRRSLTRALSQKSATAGLFATLVALTAFASQIYATAPALTVNAVAATSSNAATVGDLAWSDAQYGAEDDGTFAYAQPLDEGYFLMEDTPAIPTGTGYQISFKYDSPYAAVIQDSEDAGLSVVDTAGFELVDGVVQPAGYVHLGQFSDDGTLLAIGGNDGLTIIDSSSADPADWTIAYSTSTRNDSGLAAIALYGNSRLAVGYNDEGNEGQAQLEVLDISDLENPAYVTGAGISAEDEMPGDIYDLAFSPDGEFLVAGVEYYGVGYPAVVFDTDTWGVQYTPLVEGAIAGISLAFSPDGDRLVVSVFSFDGDAIAVVDSSAVDAGDWTMEGSFAPDFIGDSWGVDFNSDGTRLAIAYNSSPYFGLVDSSDADPVNWTAIDVSETVGELPGGKAGNAGRGVDFSSDDRYIGVAHDGGAGFSLIATQDPVTTNYLVASDFDLSVPEDATVVGLEVGFERSVEDDASRAKDSEVRLTVDDVVSGENYAKEEWWGVDEEEFYGDEDDLWGLEITPEMVNSGSLGVALSAEVFLGSVGVDSISMIVYYTVPEEEAVEEEAPTRRRRSSRRNVQSGSSAPKSSPASTATANATEDGYEAICPPHITGYIRYGADNDAEDVRKLEEFLNGKRGENVPVDGVYSAEDVEAVKRFQKDYASEILGVWGSSEPTGYVYRTTLLKINSFYCESDVSCPAFAEYNSLTENPVSAEVARTKVLLSELGFFTGEVNSTFDAALQDALRRFQEEFAETMLAPWGLSSGTGYKYKTTNKFLNLLVGCQTGAVDLDGRGTFDY